MMHRLVLSVTLTAALLGPAPAGLLDRLWAALTFWGASASPKAGCELDPSGRCLTGQTKAGCELDPNGRCLTGQTEAGCEWDPSGRCLPSQPRTEAGCEWDPNGSPKCS